MLGKSLFQFKHGDHTCVFYSDIAGLLEILTPYIAEGLRNNERCFCAQRPEVLRAFANELAFLGVNMEREVKRGALELHTTSEVYFPNRRFEPAVLMALLERSIEDSLHQGFSGFRSAGDLSWAVEGRNECDQLIEYEKMVEAAYPSKPAHGFCQYPLNRFEPHVLERVIDAHKKVIDIGGAATNHVSLSIRDAKCAAEIVVNKLTAQPAYHYVVEHVVERGDILGWGKSPSFDAALQGIQGVASETEKTAGRSTYPKA